MTPPFEEKQKPCKFKLGPKHSLRCKFGGRCNEENCPLYSWAATEYPPPINHEKERGDAYDLTTPYRRE